jgi:hypothetical protein
MPIGLSEGVNVSFRNVFRVLAALGEWIKLMGSDWVGRISGGGSVVAAFAALYFKWVAENPKPSLWIVAGVSFFIASFWVWYKDRPRLQCEVEELFIDQPLRTVYTDPDISTNNILALLYMVNTHQLPNAIKSYNLFLRLRGKWIPGSQISASGLLVKGSAYRDLAELRMRPLQQAVPLKGLVRFGFDNNQNLAAAPFRLIIKDVYGATFKLIGQTPTRSSEDDEITFMEDQLRSTQLSQFKASVALQELSAKGDDLLKHIEATSRTSIANRDAEIDDWERVTADTILQIFGMRSMSLFLSNAPLLVYPHQTTHSGRQRRLNQVYTRLTRLNALIEQHRITED